MAYTYRISVINQNTNKREFLFSVWTNKKLAKEFADKMNADLPALEAVVIKK